MAETQTTVHTIELDLNQKTVIKTTLVVCTTVFALKVAGFVVTPAIEKLNKKLKHLNEKEK